MKLLPLYDLQQEINRLFIAGSKFAKNDPRLQKQAAVFNKLGEKSPVLRKIAEGIDALVNAESVDSSARLLEISTLLYSVLYTQGETVDTGQQESKLTPVLHLDDVYTGMSYLTIFHLFEISSVQMGGRIDYLKVILESGLVNDFRIYRLLVAALEDRDGEFADYIETAVIPEIGKPMIPFIVNSFSYEGRESDVRRFRLLRDFDYHGISEMVDKILAGNSMPLQIEAMKTLGINPDNEELLIKFIDDRHKPVRLAAYKALAGLKTESAERVLVDLFVSDRRKTDISELGEILRTGLSEVFVPVLLNKAKADYEKCIGLDKFADVKIVVGAFKNLNASMNTLFNNINKDVMEFYREIFTCKQYRERSKTVNMFNCYMPELIAASAAKNMEKVGEGFQYLKFLTENSDYDEFLFSCFKMAVKNKLNKKKVFDYFSKYVNKLIKGNVLVETFFDRNGNFDSNNVDERWEKFFIIEN
jgi:hypothetical protein